MNIALTRLAKLHLRILLFILSEVDEDAVQKYLILINLVSDKGGIMIHRGPYALT